MRKLFAGLAVLALGATLAYAGFEPFVTTKKLTVTGTSKLEGVVTAPKGIVGNVTGNVTGTVSGSALGPVPATQVIGAGGTIAADACGGIKNISSATAVTTDTTNTFTAPAAGNAGCIMQVCNVNASDAITLDDNALANLSGIAGGTPGNTVLGALDCVSVGSTGSVWNQLAPGSQN